MPLTPSYGDRLVGPLVRLYLIAERALWRLIASTLDKDESFGQAWLFRVLTRIPAFRSGAARVALGLAHDAAMVIAAILTGAWESGQDAARVDLGLRRRRGGDAELRALIDEVTTSVASVHDGLPHVAESVLRQVAAEVAADPRITTDADRRAAIHRALTRAARRGFVSYVDRHGRRYELVSYVEMTVRAAVSRAEVEGYTQAVAAEGHDLIIVSDVPGACELCRPFEGHVISISGETAGTVTLLNSGGAAVHVTVLCSLAEARRRGLFHIGCRHTIRVWTADEPSPPPASRLTDQQRQQRTDARKVERRDRLRRRLAAVS